jgi:hypothetical protein
MTYRGRVHNGVVVIEGGAALPEGTIVTIETHEVRAAADAEDPLYKLGELATASGIPDLALNIDHYLYGHPKVSDARQ